MGFPMQIHRVSDNHGHPDPSKGELARLRFHPPGWSPLLVGLSFKATSHRDAILGDFSPDPLPLPGVGDVGHQPPFLTLPPRHPRRSSPRSCLLLADGHDSNLRHSLYRCHPSPGTPGCPRLVFKTRSFPLRTPHRVDGLPHPSFLFPSLGSGR